MLGMIGQTARVGVAACQYGIKVVFVDHHDGNQSTFHLAPPGQVYLDLSIAENQEFEFQFWLEILRLSCPLENVVAIFFPRRPSTISTCADADGAQSEAALQSGSEDE